MILFVEDTTLLNVESFVDGEFVKLKLYATFEEDNLNAFYGLSAKVPYAINPGGYLLIFSRSEVAAKVMNGEMVIRKCSQFANIMHKIHVSIMPVIWFFRDITGGYKL